MYIVFAEKIETDPVKLSANTVVTLDQAFARICCHCGLSYRFTAEDHGWLLELTDVEHPDQSPEPMRSSYTRPQDAQHDLMTQAVDGRIRGHIAISDDLFDQTCIIRTVQGTRAHVV